MRLRTISFRAECHLCAKLVDVPALKHGQTANCPRCKTPVTTFNRHAIDYLLAFSIAGLVFLVASIPFDFLTFKAQGQQGSMALPGAVISLLEQNFFFLALVQLVTIFLIPTLIFCGLIYLLLPLSRGRTAPPGKATVFKMIHKLIPWGMAEIFLIGTLVSLFKVSSMADIELGRSFYAFVLFALCVVITVGYLDEHQLRLQLGLPPIRHKGHRLSKQHTWALLITAAVLYIPASVQPIMTTRVLGADQPSTIMGGVILLWQHGSYPIALIIFVASVMIPIAKILVLGWLNYTVHTGKMRLLRERIKMYRFTEFIGRWSMIDVFVVAVLVSLIHLGNTMSVYPGAAALSFCGVVILTMLAANSFDSHLIWNPKGPGNTN